MGGSSKTAFLAVCALMLLKQIIVDKASEDKISVVKKLSRFAPGLVGLVTGV